MLISVCDSQKVWTLGQGSEEAERVGGKEDLAWNKK